jgi:hypothetical protein
MQILFYFFRENFQTPPKLKIFTQWSQLRVGHHDTTPFQSIHIDHLAVGLQKNRQIQKLQKRTKTYVYYVIGSGVITWKSSTWLPTMPVLYGWTTTCWTSPEASKPIKCNKMQKRYVCYVTGTPVITRRSSTWSATISMVYPLITTTWWPPGPR